MSAIAQILGSMSKEQLQAVLGEKFSNHGSSEKDETMRVTIGEYKGSPTISLKKGTGMPFTFGVAKAGMILEAIKEIEKFHAKNLK
jgi:hypothetical protein